MAKKDGSMKILKTTKRLPVKLSDDELLERGKQLVESMRKTAVAEAEREADNKKRKGDIALMEEVTSRLASIIRDGQEDREVECELRKDFEHSSVTTVRTDTGEIVDTRVMDNEERQEQMFERQTHREPAKGKGADPFEDEKE